jgi:DNA-binding SARP family transcriptional activator
LTGKLQIRLLGELQLLYGDAVVSGIDSPRLQSLLAYLLLHRNTPLTRSQLAYLLWPDSSDSQARTNLRVLLLRLRRLLPEADLYLHSEGHYIQWQPTSPFTLDVASFERHLATAQAARQTGSEDDFETAATQAVAIYSGDLLPNCYDNWIMPIRERLREGVVSCLAGLAETAERTHRYEAAYSHYLALTRLNPLWEAAYRGVMRALAGMGRLPEAITAYNQLRQLLAEEMEVAPAAETQQLASRLHEELAVKTAVQREDTAKRPPFVGRVKERALLLDRLDKLPGGQGDIVLVLGEAGMGKTRLLEEAAQAAEWRGWPVAWGRSQEFTRPSAYAPLTQALTVALPRLRVQQLARLMPGPVLATIAPLVPVIQELLPASETPPGPSLPAAIGQLWRALQTISPHLFILEDGQWADPAFWLLLDELRPYLAETAVLLIVSGRLQELKQQEIVWTVLRQWDQASHPFIILDGFSLVELGDLSQAAGWGVLDDTQEERLRQASGGNPLLALSLLEAGDWSGSTSDPTLVGQVMRRLVGVSTAANEALQAAAVIGYQFDYDLWEAVSGLDPARLPALAGEMEQAGLIRLAQDGYCFAHDTLRACVYTQTPPLRRQLLHDQALSLLAERQPLDPFALLYHAEQAGDAPAITRYALQAGLQALASHAYQAAVTYFSQALSMLPEADWTHRYTAVHGRQQALDILAQRPEQAADVALLEEIAAQLDEQRQAEAAAARARYCLVMGDYEAAQAIAAQGLEKARRTADLALQAGLLHSLAQAKRSQGEYETTQQLAAKARALFQQAGSRHGEATMSDFLGGLAWRVGDYPAAATLHAAAAEMFRGLADPFREAMALNNLGTAYWSLGDYPQARATHERALAVNRRLGHRRGEADNLDNLGGVAWVLGDYDTAVDFYNQALSLRRQMGDRWGMAISLGNLGSARRLQGKLDEALTYFSQAQQWNQELGRRSGEGYNLHGRGLTLLEAGRLAEANEALRTAYGLRRELGEGHNLMDTVGGLALLRLAEGDLPQAQICVDEMLSLLAAGGAVRPSLRQWVHFVAYAVCLARGEEETALAHLIQSEAAMHEIAALLSSQEAGRFYEQVPLNQKLLAAVAAHSQVISASLVRVGTPAGRKLTPADYIEIVWTIATPADKQIVNLAERRRHVLQRLLAEAKAQGAAPTADDLAAVLGVNRRTILRDMKLL